MMNAMFLVVCGFLAVVDAAPATRLIRLECSNVDCSPNSCLERQLNYGECTYLEGFAVRVSLRPNDTDTTTDRSIIARSCSPGGYVYTQRYIERGCPGSAGWASFRYREGQCISEDGHTLMYLCPNTPDEFPWWGILLICVGAFALIAGGVFVFARWRMKKETAERQRLPDEESESAPVVSRRGDVDREREPTAEPVHGTVVQGIVVNAQPAAQLPTSANDQKHVELPP